MAGRRRKKIKPICRLTDIVEVEVKVKDNNSKDDSMENVEIVEPQPQTQPQKWADLPPELLELILSPLKLADNLRASTVCKSWNSVACSVRVVSQSPWLMYFTKSFGLYEFYDPKNRKAHFVVLPELVNSIPCYTRDGWLLMLHKHIDKSLFFFNPFTLEIINLPNLEMTHPIVAFSAAPTSDDCIVFTLKNITPEVVTVSTCRHGEKEWSTVDYENHYPFDVTDTWNKLVFCRGKFYCFSLRGWLGIYNPLGCTWDVVSLLSPKCPECCFADSRGTRNGKYIVEYNGEPFFVYTCFKRNKLLYKLDQENMSWELIKSLDGVTLFVSFLTSHSRTDLLGLRRNSIYFPKVRFYGKRCIMYSLDDDRYYPKNNASHNWEAQDPFKSIWIEPPKDFTSFTSEKVRAQGLYF